MFKDVQYPPGTTGIQGSFGLKYTTEQLPAVWSHAFSLFHQPVRVSPFDDFTQPFGEIFCHVLLPVPCNQILPDWLKTIIYVQQRANSTHIKPFFSVCTWHGIEVFLEYEKLVGMNRYLFPMWDFKWCGGQCFKNFLLFLSEQQQGLYSCRPMLGQSIFIKTPFNSFLVQLVYSLPGINVFQTAKKLSGNGD